MITVSIITPLYNRITLVQETIQSVQAQTYPHWEMIVVDDGSSDGSFEAVEQLAMQDTRIRLYKRERLLKGAPVCRNLGAELASGEYLIFLDSDDLLASYCLERRIAAFQKYPDYDFLVFPMLMFKNQPYDQDIIWNVDTQEDDLTRFLRVDAVWQTTCPIYRKSIFLELGRFDESLTFWQDYELHTRLLISGLKYRKFLDHEPDCFYRQHEQATVSQEVNVSKERLETMENVYKGLYKRLKRSPYNTAHNKLQIASMYFWLNMAWIEHHQNFQHVRNSWLYCYQQQIININPYILGLIYFFLKNQQLKIPGAKLVLKILAKPFALLLPSVYHHRRVTTAKMHVNRQYLPV